jgi:putative membrane protein
MLERAQEDNVSNIHRRWSFTQLSPSSFRQSFAGSLLCGGILVVIVHFYYLQSEPAGMLPFLALGAGVLAVLHFADYLALRGTPVNKLSKVGHVSLFANVLWLLTGLLGIASDSLFSKTTPDLDYVVAGMFLASGLRVGIFTSVFGASLARAALVSFLMPLAFLFAFIPAAAHPSLFSSYLGVSFGIVIYMLGMIWVVVADRAGRPMVRSTFRILQAFLSAWTEKDPTKMEEFTEGRAQEESVGTSVIKFSRADGSFAAAIVLPDIHPGPFGTVGGSNLPYVLYQNYGGKALVMHSVSDHSLNIPSKREVDRYLKSISSLEIVERGDSCSLPSQTKVGRSTTTGLAFGRAVVVMLSLAPYGMEDVPQSVRAELESYGKEIGFSEVLVVDCHNAMGKQLDDEDKRSLLSSAKQCLDNLVGKPQEKFRVGFSDLADSGISIASEELGQSGVAVMVFSAGDQNHAIGWADSNNMENSLRDHIMSKVAGELSMLEVCTSDTHSTSGTRTKEGYHALGSKLHANSIASAFASIARKARDNATEFCTYELGKASSKVRVMGKKQFEDYSSALDSSMKVTKVFLGVTIAVYVAMLLAS